MLENYNLKITLFSEASHNETRTTPTTMSSNPSHNAANGASLNTHTQGANESLEHRLVNMQSEFNQLRAQLLERNNNNPTDGRHSYIQI
jgi:hypothetical protein|tara:strand:+ start:53 stop:319 length:267 start_codon:yes stop_codon:yes gene_type:complete